MSRLVPVLLLSACGLPLEGRLLLNGIVLDDDASADTVLDEGSSVTLLWVVYEPGMSDLTLFYTPVELATTDGVRGIRSIQGPVSPGFHLFDIFQSQELALDEEITVVLGHIWD